MSTSKATPSPPTHHPKHPFPSDTWSDSATSTLINAWGTHFLELNRGKLTHTHWLSVADSVNSTHPNHRPKTHIQCQNRIDTLKKRFKALKSDDPNHKPTWAHFKTLDYLIGGNTRKKPRRLKSSSPDISSPESSPERLPVAEWKVPVGKRTKRKHEVVVGGGEEEGRKERRGGDGMGVLADAIGRLGMLYERVEMEKSRQMVELEKQRMLFFRDLEILRMEFFMESRGVFMNKL